MQYDFKFRSRRSNVIAKNGMAASSHPLATLAGLDILRAGGSAADAAIAMAAALNVVEPFSTGVGGDCFALYWEAATKRVHALNGSGPAGGKASIESLQRAGYEQMPLYGGQAVSVPGTVAGWAALSERFGRMPLKTLLASAIHYALEGFPVTEWIGSGWQRMAHCLLRGEAEDHLPLHLRRAGPAQPSGAEFLIHGRAPAVGELMTLPTLGATLQAIAADGRQAFYEGAFAQRLCDYVQRYGGYLEPEDLRDFQAEWVEPIFTDYHDVRLYECPPNGQGLAAVVAAQVASGFDLANLDLVERTHTLIECMRLGFTEALQWVSDPQAYPIPLGQILSTAYTNSRRKLIHPDRAIRQLKTAVQPVGDDTVYLSAVDADGNACSFINSLYMGGGTGLVVPGTGVFLQNRAALFSLDPGHPNALQGGKRPYHTIIPGMLTRGGELLASFGIMGGFMQPQAHLQVLSHLVDLGYNPQQALDMPRFCLRVEGGGGVGADDPGGEVFMEAGFSFDDLARLRKKGHRLSPVSGRERVVFGGGQIIQRDHVSGVLTAGSDPRKDGCALGY